MVYRKGELSKRALDRGWPHQVALPANRCTGPNFVSIRYFCEGLSLGPRGHCFRRNHVDFNVYCFADPEHAERFCARFNGELTTPAERPQWGGRE